MQRPDAGLGEWCCPTEVLSIARLLAALACEQNLALRRFDVGKASGQFELDGDVFVRLPPGCGSLSGKIVTLNNSLYGLREACRQWHSHLEGCLMASGLTQCVVD